MIDYEKLKLAHELAFKYTRENDAILDITIEAGYSMPQFTIRTDGVFERYLWIDDLITKLKELTKLKPKYEVGQEVWFIDCTERKGPISHGEVLHVEQKTMHFNEIKNFVCVGGYSIPEESVYHSKESLIESMIEFWTSLKNQENSTGVLSVSTTVHVMDNCPDCGADLSDTSGLGLDGIWRRACSKSCGYYREYP